MWQTADHDRIEAQADWLRAALNQLLLLKVASGADRHDVRRMGQILGMCEVDRLRIPSMSVQEEGGVAATWSGVCPRSGGVMMLHVMVSKKQVSFLRYLDGKRVHIPHGLLDKRNAETIRILLRWIFGEPIIPHEAGAMYDEITPAKGG